MKKIKGILIILGILAAFNSIAFGEGRILKNELPKNQKEFFESDRLIDIQKEVKEPGEDENTEDLPKFHVKRIILKKPSGYTKPIVNPKKLDAIMAGYRNTEMNIVDLRRLIKSLNEEYASKGYIMARVYLEPDQNIAETGEIRLVVLEGKIEEVVLDEDTPADRRKVFFAFTNEKNRVLNIFHMDNGIDNLNRVESNSSRIDIVPGDRQGYSKILLKSEKKKPFRFIVNYEDTQKDKARYRVTAEYDNLFGINDIIHLSYKGDMGKLAKKREHRNNYSENYSFGYSFPFKSWTFSLSYDRSEDNSMILGNAAMYKYESESSQYGLNVSKLLYRNSGMKLNLSMGLDVKRERNRLADHRLETQDRNITVASIGLNGMFKPFKGIATYGLTYSRGLKGLRAFEDNSLNAGTLSTPSIEPYDSRYQFGKFNINFGYYKPFYFRNQGLTLRTSVNGQYSRDVLFSTEKFSIGGFDTVKGFPTTVSGDMGYSTRLELGYIFPVEQDGFFYRVRPYVEADLGKVRNNYNEYGDRKGRIATLSSYSLGVRYYGEVITLDAGVAKTDSGRSLMKADSHRGYVSLTATF